MNFAKQLRGISCLFALLPIVLSAQWSPLPTPPPGTSGLEKVFFPTATTGFTFALNSDVYKTANGGGSWSKVYSWGQVTGFDSYLFRDLFFTDAQNGVMVGWDFWSADYLILRTGDGGQSWVPFTYEFGLNIGECYAVDFPTNQTGYVVGDWGRVFKTTNGGVNWMVGDAPTGGALIDVDFVSATTGYALTQAGDQILKTTNGASSWQTINISGTAFYQIQFLDALTGFGTGNNGIYKTTNGGQSWQPLGAFTFGPTKTHFFNASTGTTLAGGQFFKTVDGGQQWFVQQFDFTVPDPLNDGASLADFFMLDQNTGFAAGYKNIGGNVSTLVAKTANGGGLGLKMSISPEYMVCPQPLTATASFIGTPATVKWWVDGTPFGSGNATEVFSAPWTSGEHQVKVEIASGANKVSLDKTFTVEYVPTTADFAWTTYQIPTIPCAGESARIYVGNLGVPPNPVQLRLGNTIVDGPKILGWPGDDFLLTPPLSDTTTFTVEYVHPCGVVHMGDVNVPVRPLPDLTKPVWSDSPGLLCKAVQNIEIKVGNTDPSGAYMLLKNGVLQNWQWVPGNGNELIFNTYQQDSTATWSIRALNQYGCAATLHDTVLIQFEHPVARFGTNGLNLPAGTPVAVNFEGQEAVTYDWDFGQGATPPVSSAENPGAVNYAGTEATQIRLVVTAPLGCRDTLVKNIGFYTPGSLSPFWAQEMDLAAQQQSLILGQNMEVDVAGNIFLDGSTTEPLWDSDNFGANLASRAGAQGYLPEFHWGILKYDPAGVLLWHLSTPGNQNFGMRDIESDAAGNIYVSYGIGQKFEIPASDDKRRIVSAPSSASLIVKYDPQGRILWVAQVRGCGGEAVPVLDTELGPDGNLYLYGNAWNSCGEFIAVDSTSGQKLTISYSFAAKITPDGQFLWAKALENAPQDSWVYGFALRVDPAGNLYICGESTTALIKLDPDGNLLWKLNTLSDPVAYMNIRNFDIDDAGNAYVAGFYRGEIEFPGMPKITSDALHGSDYDLFVMKVGPDGTPLWLKGSDTQDYTDNTSVQYHDGAVYLYGSFGKGPFELQGTGFVTEGHAWRNVLMLRLSAATGDYEAYFLLDTPNPAAPGAGEYYACQGRSLQVDDNGHLHLLGSNGYEAVFGNTTLSTPRWMFLAKMEELVVDAKEPEHDKDLNGEETGNLQAGIFPNPGGEEARLQVFLKEGGTTLRAFLVDMTGRRTMLFEKENCSAGTSEIPLGLPRNTLANGIYFIEILGDSGQRARLKWVKE